MDHKAEADGYGTDHTGYGEKTYPDGSQYFGNLVLGVPQGAGMLTRPNGTVYEGAFQDGLPHGAGALRQANGKQYRGTWVQGRATNLTLVHDSVHIAQPAGTPARPDAMTQAAPHWRAWIFQNRGPILLGALATYFAVALVWPVGVWPRQGPSMATAPALTRTAPTATAAPLATPNEGADISQAALVTPPQVQQVSQPSLRDRAADRLLRLGDRMFVNMSDAGKIDGMLALPVPQGWERLLNNPDDDAVLAVAARARIANMWKELDAQQVEAIFDGLEGNYQMASVYASAERLYPHLFREAREAERRMQQEFQAAIKEHWENMPTPAEQDAMIRERILGGHAPRPKQAEAASPRPRVTYMTRDQALDCRSDSFVIQASTGLAQDYLASHDAWRRHARELIASGKHRNDSPELIRANENANLVRGYAMQHRQIVREVQAKFNANCTDKPVARADILALCAESDTTFFCSNLRGQLQ